MAVEGCEKCIKYVLFAFNLVFWILGCAILGIGLYVRFSPQNQQIFGIDEFQFLRDVQYTGAYVLIAVGAVMMLVGFLGCCGAIRENQCLLVSFFLCLLIMFLVMLACAIWTFVMLSIREKETKKLLTDELLKKVATYSGSPDFMDDLQYALACCGARNSNDYTERAMKVPASCGDELIDTIQYENGCATMIFSTFYASVLFIGAAAVIVSVALIFGMIFSMCLTCGIRRGYVIA